MASDLKIVKVRCGASFVFSIRCGDANGVETEISSARSQAEATSIVERLNAIEFSEEAGLIARLAVAALISITRTAKYMATVGDTQADRNYATKSHMRGWSQEIASVAESVLEVALPASAAGEPYRGEDGDA